MAANSGEEVVEQRAICEERLSNSEPVVRKGRGRRGI